MSILSPTNETNPAEKETTEKLMSFCKQFAQVYRQIRTLTSTERSNVDKTASKASRYELLRKVNASEGACTYSEQQVERIRTESLHEINNRLIATGRLIQETAEDLDKLLRTYRGLQYESQQLDWSTAEMAYDGLICGNEKRKPLEYYLQQGFRAMYQLNGIITRIKLVFGAVDFQRADSIQRLRDCLKMPEELDLYLREFMAFSVFLVR